MASSSHYHHHHHYYLSSSSLLGLEATSGVDYLYFSSFLIFLFSLSLLFSSFLFLFPVFLFFTLLFTPVFSVFFFFSLLFLFLFLFFSFSLFSLLFCLFSSTFHSYFFFSSAFLLFFRLFLSSSLTLSLSPPLSLSPSLPDRRKVGARIRRTATQPNHELYILATVRHAPAALLFSPSSLCFFRLLLILPNFTLRLVSPRTLHLVRCKRKGSFWCAFFF